MNGGRLDNTDEKALTQTGINSKTLPTLIMRVGWFG